MKTIGLIGGMSWESTITYYQVINRVIGQKLGGWHSAKLILYSVDFGEIERLQHEGHWKQAGHMLADAAQRLERAGADFLVICTNTMHCVADQIDEATSIPMLHIADATANEIKSKGIERVGLLGTRFTMEESFYRGRLQSIHGLEVHIPESEHRQTIHRIIYDELCQGDIREESRQQFVNITRDLIEQGCQAIVLGCTEIGLLIGPHDADVPVFDTALIHANQAALMALQD